MYSDISYKQSLFKSCSTGLIQYTGSALHGIQIIDIDGPSVSEQHYQYSETDGRFCSCNSQDKKYKYLAGNIMHEMREGDEVHVDSQQHQLDAHQQHDHIFTVNKYPGHTDAKKYRGKDQHIG